MTHKPHPVVIEQFGWKTESKRDQLASILMAAVILGGIAIVLDLKLAPNREIMGRLNRLGKVLSMEKAIEYALNGYG